MVEKVKVLMIAKDDDFSRYIKDELELKNEFFIHFENSAQSGLSVLRNNFFDVLIVDLEVYQVTPADFVKELKKADPIA